jgi:hypothetical protein
MNTNAYLPPFRSDPKPPFDLCNDAECENVKCKWVCRQKPVEMKPKPVCDPPKTKIVCNPAPIPKCRIKTSKPKCKVECKKKENDCFDCQTVCEPLKTELVCDKPKPVCKIEAPPPKCRRDYELPKKTTRPQCKLVCPFTDGASYSPSNFDVDN